MVKIILIYSKRKVIGEKRQKPTILFTPHAFVLQGQKCASLLPSPLVFRTISTDITPTPCVPQTSRTL